MEDISPDLFMMSNKNRLHNQIYNNNYNYYMHSLFN